MAEEILKAMKYSNAIISKVKLAIEHHVDFSSYMGSSIPRPSVIRRFVSNFNGDDDALNIALDLIHANNISQMYGKKIKLVPGIRGKIKELDKKNESGKKIVVPIDGNDIMKEFKLKPSPILGTIMTKLKQKVIEDPSLTKEGALKFVEEYLAKVV
jgi:poly(A) polymerase/tRNA nucleotidyltransferase (CCA-adding enzyme)